MDSGCNKNVIQIGVNMYSTKIHVEREGPEGIHEIEVEVYGDVTPIRPGKFGGLPENCYPSEGGDIDITDCFVNGQPFELFGREFEIATDALWKAANDAWEAAAEDAAVSRYEARENYGL
jgi:hypothetical protein